MKKREIPKGLRDFLPREVKVRRNMENKAARLFNSYGYQEVATPTIEYLEVVESGAGHNIREDLFLFMDRDGGIVSLRPEMTVSLARLAATHLRDERTPQRLYYMANMFRQVQPQKAQYREFWQLGVELLGASGVWSDAEVITVAAKSLLELGLKDFKISLNQIDIFNGLLEQSNLADDEQKLIRFLVESKDLVDLSNLLEELPMDDQLKESIALLPVLHGGLEVLKRIPAAEKNRKTAEAIEDLIKVYEALQVFGINEHIVVDMGVLRNLDYYTGIVFEGYSPDLGYGLLGGGRYDNLLGRFGYDCPATGFALGMDRLALVLGKQQTQKEELRYIVGGTDLKKIVKETDSLRAQGFIAEMDVEGSSREELQQRLAHYHQDHQYSLIFVD
ncbi:MAG: ATP phosphoribosyltransferase regulatory subunit [Syntrophomonadaceae bacterium]|nr:ATP phosphoribosyltransferase regulatory subunit [Syntrophomonadaceae bacterium]